MQKQSAFRILIYILLVLTHFTGAFAAEIGYNDRRISRTGSPVDSATDARYPSIAYNSTHDEFLVVWIADPINGEFEVYGQRILAQPGNEVGTDDFRISDMGPDGNASYVVDTSAPPGIVYNPAADEYLVVWAGEEVDGALEIYGQRIYGDRSLGDELGTNDFRISDMGSHDGFLDFDAYAPDVAYNSTNNEYLVVWHGDDDSAGSSGEDEIYGQRLDGSTCTQVGNNDFRISTAGPNGDITYDAEQPDVVWNSTNNEYLVVWEADDNTGFLVEGETEIFGQRIHGDRASGDELGSDDFRISDMGPDGNSAYDADHAAVAWNSTDNEYLVVWESDDSTAPLVDGELEIFGQRLNAATGAAVGSNDFRISDMGPDGNASYDANEPDVVYNPTSHEYLVVWDGDDNNAPLVEGEMEVFVQRLDAATGAEVGNNDVRISDMGPDGDTSYDADNAAVAHSTPYNQYLVAWNGDDSVGKDEIFIQSLDYTPPIVQGVGTPSLGGLAEGATVPGPIFQLAVGYNEEVNNASLVSSYLLLNDGGDGFETTSCAGGIAGNDAAITINAAGFGIAPRIAVLDLNNTTALPNGNYRLLVCGTGTTPIQDMIPLSLDGNGDGIAGDDFVRNFSVDAAYTLTVAGAGTGSGSMTDATPGGAITCASAGGVTSGDCDETAGLGAAYAVVATPQAGSGITSWTGCDSISTTAIAGDTCNISPYSNTTITAEFNLLAPEEYLTLTKCVSRPGSIASMPFSYTLTLTNTGSTSVAGITVTDSVPAGLDITGISVTNGGVSNVAGQDVTVTYATLGAGQESTITIELVGDTPYTSGFYCNSATVAAGIFSDTTPAACCNLWTPAEAGTVLPTVNLVSLFASYLQSGPDTITVTFNRDVYDPAGSGDIDDVTNPANYLLIEAGDNGTFETAACGVPDPTWCGAPGSGGLQGDDVPIAISGVTYDSGTYRATLTLGGALSPGDYHFFVCGTTSIVSPDTDPGFARPPLNGGRDSVFGFQVFAPSLPDTGFAPGTITELPPQTAANAYSSTDLRLEIPRLGVSVPITGVPLLDGGWDVTWLGQRAGWLEGTAFPTHPGNTGITGHVWDASNNPGPFERLRDLRFGDLVEIHAWGSVYTYSVRSNSLTLPWNSPLDHEEYDWVTLITCEGYSPRRGSYITRRVVRAVLVDVRGE